MRYITNFIKRIFGLSNFNTPIENTPNVVEYNGHVFEHTKFEKFSIKQFVLDYLIDSQIDLSSVYIQDINRNGSCVLFKKTKRYGNVDLFNGVKFSNVFDKDKEYLILPELKENYNRLDYFYTASVWIHEIAHYIFKHNIDSINHTIKHEYEACLYSEKILEKMPIYSSSLPTCEFGKKISEHDINIRNILLKYVKYTNRSYVKSFYDKMSSTQKMFFVNEEIKKYINDLKNYE